jgi:hypothetical protein
VDSRQAAAERVPDAGQPLRADPLHALEPAIVRRRFQSFQGIDA